MFQIFRNYGIFLIFLLVTMKDPFLVILCIKIFSIKFYKNTTTKPDGGFQNFQNRTWWASFETLDSHKMVKSPTKAAFPGLFLIFSPVSRKVEKLGKLRPAPPVAMTLNSKLEPQGSSVMSQLFPLVVQVCPPFFPYSPWLSALTV